MPKPHKRQDRQDAQQALTYLQKLRYSDLKTVQWGIQYYVANSVASHTHLRMKTEEDAKRYKAFIQELGFPRRRIHCQLKPQRRPGYSSPETQAKYWANALSIHSQQISFRTSIEKRGAEMGSLCMTLINEEGNASSYGFRYAFYMMAIFMLAAGEITI